MDKKDKWDKLGWILFTCVVAIAVSAYTLQYYKIISSLSAGTKSLAVGLIMTLLLAAAPITAPAVAI